MRLPDGDATAKSKLEYAGRPSARLCEPAASPMELPTSRKAQVIHVAPAVLDAASKDAEAVLRDLRTSPAGLTQAEADERARDTGPNEIAQERKQGWPTRVLKIIRNPLVILLTTLSTVSFLSGDARAGSVMALMVALSVGLRFIQEARADSAAEKLKAMIHVTATVVRDGAPREVALRELVPGDIVKLAAGDMIPGDVRLLSLKDLFVSQGSLTGESLPVEKFSHPQTDRASSPAELKTPVSWHERRERHGDRCGHRIGSTHVLGQHGPFDHGRTDTDELRSGPQPIYLAHDAVHGRDGAVSVRHQRIHKARLERCLLLRFGRGRRTDSRDAADDRLGLPLQGRARHESQKSDRQAAQLHSELRRNGRAVHGQDGTLTEDRVVLMRHCNIAGVESDEVLLDGYLISYFQTGLKNLLDRAILESTDFRGKAVVDKYQKLDELPFDFTRRMMSVLVQDADGKAILFTKGHRKRCSSDARNLNSRVHCARWTRTGYTD